MVKTGMAHPNASLVSLQQSQALGWVLVVVLAAATIAAEVIISKSG